MTNMISVDPANLIEHAVQMERAGQALLEAAKKMRSAGLLLQEIAPSLSTTNGKKSPKKPHSLVGATRLDQLRNLLRERGPMTRQEVRKASGFPVGTVNSLLTVAHFSRSDDGKWSVKTGG